MTRVFGESGFCESGFGETGFGEMGHKRKRCQCALLRAKFPINIMPRPQRRRRA